MSKLTEYKCFECEGEKWNWINHEDQAPTMEPCGMCKGEGKLMYSEEEMEKFFPEFILTDKLTRIKKRHKETKKLCETVPLLKLDINFDEIGYLLSLLEEKDKALSFYEANENYILKPAECDWDDSDTGYIDISAVQLDRGTIARTALNTMGEEPHD